MQTQTRKTRAHLTVDVIVDASLELLRHEHPGEFTLTKLAKMLGVSTPSLYSHVPSKQFIVEQVRSRIVTNIDVSGFDRLPWDEALEAWATSYAEAFARHPQTIALMMTAPVHSVELLAQYERIVQALLDGGWPRSEVVAVFWAIESFVLGSVPDFLLSEETVQPEGDRFPLLT